MRYNFRFIVDRLNGFHFFTIISIFLKNVWEWWRISQNIHWFLTSFFGPFTVYTSTSWRESKCKMVFLFVKNCNNLVMWYLPLRLLLPHISMLWRWIWIQINKQPVYEQLVLRSKCWRSKCWAIFRARSSSIKQQ